LRSNDIPSMGLLARPYDKACVKRPTHRLREQACCCFLDRSGVSEESHTFCEPISHVVSVGEPRDAGTEVNTP